MISIILGKNVHWMTINEANFDERKSRPFLECLLRKEVLGPGCSAVSPRNIMLLGQVFHNVKVGVSASIDFSDVYDYCTGQTFPDFDEYGVMDVGAANHQVIVGPAFFGDFEDFKILELFYDSSELSDHWSDKIFGSLICSTLVPPQFIRDGQSDQTIWPGIFTSMGIVSHLALTAVPAPPPLATDLNNDPFSEGLAKAAERLCGWTRIAENLVIPDRTNEERVEEA